MDAGIDTRRGVKFNMVLNMFLKMKEDLRVAKAYLEY